MKLYIFTFLLIVFSFACNSEEDTNNPTPEPEGTDTLAIASFNIQIFGQSKMSKPEEFDEILLIPNIGWAVPEGTYTNVRMSATYDNLLFTTDNLKEYLSGGVYNFQTKLGLTEEEALDISDHFPVFMYVNSEGEDND